ncbi:MAG: hypothetical protein RLY31_2275 [Bacteroidota bacterium]|jgi:hypothetical protein
MSSFHHIICPESPLEEALLATPEFQSGYRWGTPRFGHPEGKVGLHVREVLDNIDGLGVDVGTRRDLRLVAMAHDTFKYREFEQGRRVRHHGLLAREYMESRLDNPLLLDVIELHDEAFYIWRLLHLHHEREQAHRRLDRLLGRMAYGMNMYYLFYKCDTQTGDKTQRPLRWFAGLLRQLELPAG